MQRVLSAAFGAALLLSTGVLATGPFAVTPAAAHDVKFADFTIEHPWARASAGPARNSAAFMIIHNGGGADRLIAASGDVAERVELHTHKMEGNVMKMRQVEAVDIPAGGMAALQPGSFHVMLIGLREALKEGDRFPLTLSFEKAGSVTVEVAVEAISSMGQQGGQDGMGQGGMGQGNMNHGNMPKSN
ncbi:copper chaperone PCu(A)C [Pelagibius sp. CAU 1746]|uniref:copper chaperone PCu(A)C n=1 Tax=Pelagibius sp. CAU 1746 TaxID=3140370 RepID=UPI00325AFC1C